jgi:SAM-dependent methyltransferase
MIRVLGYYNPIRLFLFRLKKRGWLQTLCIASSVIGDSLFDLVHGTETVRRIPPNEIETDSRNKRFSAGYGASKARPLLRLLNLLQLPRDATFVDLGCGKGRVLMLAAKYGFRRVVGIEFSRQLCEQARDNLDKFLHKFSAPSQIEIIASDVTQYRLGDDEKVFFMYDPFDAPVVAEVLAKIRKSWERKPRTIWMIYSAPRHHATIEEFGFFTESQAHIIEGGEFRTYSTAAIPLSSRI